MFKGTRVGVGGRVGVEVGIAVSVPVGVEVGTATPGWAVVVLPLAGTNGS